MPLLEVRNLTVRFPTRRAAFTAVDGVDIDVDRDEALAIVGESGSGKSVAMLAVMGLLPAQAEVSADVTNGIAGLSGVSAMIRSAATAFGRWSLKNAYVRQSIEAASSSPEETRSILAGCEPVSTTERKNARPPASGAISRRGRFMPEFE